MMAKFKSYIECIPIYALPYLINGDESGLEDGDKSAIDWWMQRNGYTDPGVIITTMPNCPPVYYTTRPAFGLPCEVEECIVLVPSEVGY